MTERIDHERLGRTTRWRILALVSLLVALMAVGLLSLRALKRATDEEERAISLLLAIDRFETALRDAEVGQRDHLLTGDERGLERFEAAAKELERRRGEVVEAARGDDEFLEDVERLEESVTTRLAELRRAVTMLQDRGSEEAGELVVAIEDSAAAASLREQRQVSRAEIERRTRARAEEVEGSYRVAMINLAVGGVLGILVLGVLILSMSRNLRRERMHILELEDQRELLRATLSGIDDVVITTARDGSVRFANRLGEQVFARHQLEELGRRVHDEVVGRGMEITGTPPKPELRHLTDGEETLRSFESRTAPMRDLEGRIAGAVTVLRDVSEVRRMRQTVTESEALKSAILDTAFDCIVTVDESGTVIEFNPAACRTFGYDRVDAIGRKITELLIPEEFRDACAKGMARYLETGEPRILGRQVELTGMRADGSTFPVEAFISEISFGGRTCFTSYLRDITERRRNEEAREVQIRLLALAADVGAALARPGTLAQVLNDCAAVMAAQLDARAVQIWLRESRTETVRRVGAAGDAGAAGADERRSLADGSPIARVVRSGAAETVAGDQGSVVCHPVLLDQRAIGAIVVHFDEEPFLSPGEAVASVATEIALGIARLRSEDRVQNLLEKERVRSERLEEISAAAATIHAANTRSSVIGVVQEETRRILEAVRAEVEFGEEPPSPEPNELAAPLRGRDGRSVGYLRLFSEEPGEFDRLDRFLLSQLADMAAVALDNARLYTELQEGARRKDEFLATLAHELRNPLAPIRNALRVMEHSKDDPAVVSRYRETVERQVRHLVRLVDDLLDISRIDRGKLSLKRRRAPLDRIVEAAVEASRPVIEENGHALDVSLPDDAIVVDVDEDRMVQVLLNLLNNAAKFTEHGGHIALSVRAEGPVARVRVEDDGIGIAPEQATRIFDLFAQAGRRSDRATGGLGVGLSLVRRLVEMHGGSVEVESEGVGRGSAFTVTIPVAAAEAAAGSGGAAPAAAAEPDATTRSILVVDDQRDSADTLAALLRMMGHEVRTAYDGEEAVERARERTPDLVVLDIGLPGITGYDAAQQIRRLPDGERAYLVALTGWGQEAARKRSLDAGFDRHLVKPLDPAALDDVLAALPRIPTGTNDQGDER